MHLYLEGPSYPPQASYPVAIVVYLFSRPLRRCSPSPALPLEHDKSLASMDDSSELAHAVPPKELEEIPDNTSKVVSSIPDPAVQQPGHIPIHPGAIDPVSSYDHLSRSRFGADILVPRSL